MDAPSDTTGAQMILAERLRQMSNSSDGECYAPAHDDNHDRGELAMGAVAYVTNNQCLWPRAFAPGMFKPTGDRVRDLVKAGAMIAAEIDRLLRCGT